MCVWILGDAVVVVSMDKEEDKICCDIQTVKDSEEEKRKNRICVDDDETRFGGEKEME